MEGLISSIKEFFLNIKILYLLITLDIIAILIKVIPDFSWFDSIEEYKKYSGVIIISTSILIFILIFDFFIQIFKKARVERKIIRVPGKTYYEFRENSELIFICSNCWENNSKPIPIYIDEESTSYMCKNCENSGIIDLGTYKELKAKNTKRMIETMGRNLYL